VLILFSLVASAVETEAEESAVIPVENVETVAPAAEPAPVSSPGEVVPLTETQTEPTAVESTPPAQAQFEIPPSSGLHGFSVGGMGGLTFETGGDKSGPFFSVGGFIRKQITSGEDENLSLGIGFLGANESQTLGTVTVDGTTINYYFEVLARRLFKTGLYAGGRIGVTGMNLNVKAPGTDVSGSTFAFYTAPVVGYEETFEKLSFGLDVSWGITQRSTLSVPTLGTFNLRAFSTLSFMGFVGFHF